MTYHANKRLDVSSVVSGAPRVLCHSALAHHEAQPVALRGNEDTDNYMPQAKVPSISLKVLSVVNKALGYKSVILQS